MKLKTSNSNQPTPAYIGSSWTALLIGAIGFLIGLWNSEIMLNEKGFYFTVFLFALFAAVTLQKTVRDRSEGLPVTQAFVLIAWAAFFSPITLLVIGLVNATTLELSEKGFYGMSFVLSLFAVITVQKNTRDMTDETGTTAPEAFPGGNEAAGTAMEVSDVTEIIDP